MMDVFQQRGELIDARAREKLKQHLDELCKGEQEARSSASKRFEAGPLTGYRAFSESLLREMIVFLVVLAGQLFKTKLNKMLFYADMNHFRLHGVSISGATYVHLPLGPVPDDYDWYLYALKEEGAIQSIEVPDLESEALVATRKPDLDAFPDTAKSVLRAVHKAFKTMSGKQLVEVSHDEDGYRETKQGEPISYEYADRLKVKVPIETVENG
jgi:uncharacterized phage-associated protein